MCYFLFLKVDFSYAEFVTLFFYSNQIPIKKKTNGRKKRVIAYIKFKTKF